LKGGYHETPGIESHMRRHSLLGLGHCGGGRRRTGGQLYGHSGREGDVDARRQNGRPDAQRKPDAAGDGQPPSHGLPKNDHDVLRHQDLHGAAARPGGSPCPRRPAGRRREETDTPSEKYKAVLWEAKDLGGLAIRNETTLPEGKVPTGEQTVVTELKDVKLGAAKASMFEVPKDYRKVANMMEMMGGMDQMKEMFKRQPKPK
jgi:hypothetical protein